MKEENYVDRLFADYEDTPEIRDFKEEITGNLRERIRELTAGGLGEEKAFEKATAELGDITSIADDLGKRRRNEAIGQMYMKAKVPITKKTAAGLTLATGLLLVGAGLFLINFLSETSNMRFYFLSVFLLADAAGTYAFFALTQETAAHYPMKIRRALAYFIVIFVGVFGEGLASVLFFFDGMALSTALGMECALVFPAVCALVFLILTESDRKKTWLKAMVERERENSMKHSFDMVDPTRAARFGVISASVWVLAVALFILLFFQFEWEYAWVVFPFALADQLLLLAWMLKSKNKA